MWRLTRQPQINLSLVFPSPARLWNQTMTSHAVMSFIKIFPDRCSGKSAIARVQWFTGCCLHWQLRDRETIDFLFLSFPSGRLPVQVEVVLQRGDTFVGRHWLMGRKDRRGLGKDTALRTACVYGVSSYIHLWNQRRLFTFPQADFWSRDRAQAGSHLNFGIIQANWISNNSNNEKTKRRLQQLNSESVDLDICIRCWCILQVCCLLKCRAKFGWGGL